MTPVVISPRTSGGFFVSSGYLSGGDYDAFRRSIDGASWVHAIKRWHIREDQLLQVVSRLERAGFKVSMPAPKPERNLAGAAIVLNRAIEQVQSRLADSRQSIEEIEKRLADRGHKLFDFQKKDVEFLCIRDRVLNCNEQGLGKTIETLASLPYGAAVLVVCPKEAKGTWLRECKEWRDDFSPRLIEKRADFALPAAHELLIVNFDLLPPKPELDTVKLPAPLFLVCDEFHKVKGFRTKRSESVGALSARASQAVGLSGTPLPNSPLELWACLKVFGLEREAFGSFKRLGELFYGKRQYFFTTDRKGNKVANPAGWMWGVCPTEDTESPCSALPDPKACSTCHGEAMEPKPEVPRLLERVMVRHEKKDVLKDLPPKLYKVLSVPLDAKTIKQLNRECDIGRILAAETLEELMEIESLSSGRALLAEAKIAFASSVLDEWEVSGIISIAFSAHRKPVETFGSRLGWASIIGGMREDRADIEKSFQTGVYRGLAASIGAASTALTLTKATHELFVDRAWTPADNEQAEDRAHRVGQTAGLVIVDLVADHPIDRHVHIVNMRKRGIIRAAVGKIRGERDLALPLIREMERKGSNKP